MVSVIQEKGGSSASCVYIVSLFTMLVLNLNNEQNIYFGRDLISTTKCSIYVSRYKIDTSDGIFNM